LIPLSFLYFYDTIGTNGSAEATADALLHFLHACRMKALQIQLPFIHDNYFFRAYRHTKLAALAEFFVKSNLRHFTPHILRHTPEICYILIKVGFAINLL
jgi:integrase